jgi:hypothetical protein
MRFIVTIALLVGTASGCNISLTHQLSIHSCKSTEDFGCYGNGTMWVNGGCR